MTATWPRNCRRCDHLIYPYSWMYAYEWSNLGRGLCGSCYHSLTPDQRLDYPRLSRSSGELVEEWEMLRSEGYTKRQAADRLGMTYEAFERAYHRAKKTGAVA